jgi:hypothetical protein
MDPKHDRGPLVGSLLRIANQALTERLLAWLAASEYADVQLAHLAAIQPLWDAGEGARLTVPRRASKRTGPSASVRGGSKT